MNSRYKLWMKVYFGMMFLILFLSPVNMQKLTRTYGILDAVSTSGVKETFCMIYFSDLGPVAKTEQVAESHILEDSSQTDWCNDHPEIDPRNKVLLLSPDNNCSIFVEAINIQNRGGKGIIYVADGANLHVQDNKSDPSSVNISVGYISKISNNILMKLDKPVKVTIFSPGVRGFEYSLIVLFVVAIFTICSGAYLSKGERFKFMQQSNKQRRSSSERARNTQSAGENRGNTRFSILDEQVVNVPAIYVFLLVLLMSGMLLLVYFFFDYLVYFMIGMFTIASVGSIYFCLEPFVSKIPLNILKFNCLGCDCGITKVLLFAFALGVAIFWVINRNHQYGWILQDILGVFFSVHMLKTIRLGNLKMCTLILSLLFIYDIFFVFVTPLLTKKGTSIMEEVARGGNTSEMVVFSEIKVDSEMVPMVLKVIHLGYDSMSVCYTEFSILGLGDILVPGLLVSYCMWFDVFTTKRKLYFWVSIIGYAVGMIATYLGLFLMAMAQPALLYLVPCCLLPPVALAYCQGELKAMWTGIINRKGDSSNGAIQEVSTNIVPEQENATTTAVAEDHNSQEVSKSSEISQDERNCLIK